MKTHTNMASRILGILAIAVTVGWLQPTAAYGQTAENTVIVNTATVSFSDANSNTYSTVDGVANVTVGHAAGINVVAAQATATPVSPSTLNTMVFHVINIGNGTDSVSVAENNSDATVLTVTKFTHNSTDYANIGKLCLDRIPALGTICRFMSLRARSVDEFRGDPHSGLTSPSYHVKDCS